MPCDSRIAAISLLRAKRTHTACFGQKKPSLLAGEVRAIRMTVHFRPAHMLARIAVDIPLLAEIAVEAAYDAQILAVFFAAGRMPSS